MKITLRNRQELIDHICIKAGRATTARLIETHEILCDSIVTDEEDGSFTVEIEDHDIGRIHPDKLSYAGIQNALQAHLNESLVLVYGNGSVYVPAARRWLNQREIDRFEESNDFYLYTQ